MTLLPIIMTRQQLKIIAILFLVSTQCFSQSFDLSLLPASVNSSFRGLSVVDDSIAWVSGSNATTGFTSDGGKTWSFTIVNGHEKLDFRSIFAFNEQEAVIANAGSPAYILRTEDAGNTWKTVYINDNPLCFIDGVDFWNDKDGIVYGDPLDGRLFIAITGDGGRTWSELPPENRPVVSDGEASFAASGTGIRCYGKKKVVIITGGTVSRLHVSEDGGHTWCSSLLPVIQGEPATGAFSVAFHCNKKAIIAGGDYTKETQTVDHIFYSSDGGKKWMAPVKPTGGFRECVIYYKNNCALAIGPGGSDYTTDGGKNWQTLSTEKGLHVVAKARKGSLIIAAGNKKIGVIKSTK